MAVAVTRAVKNSAMFQEDICYCQYLIFIAAGVAFFTTYLKIRNPVRLTFHLTQRFVLRIVSSFVKYLSDIIPAIYLAVRRFLFVD